MNATAASLSSRPGSEQFPYPYHLATQKWIVKHSKTPSKYHSWGIISACFLLPCCTFGSTQLLHKNSHRPFKTCFADAVVPQVLQFEMCIIEASGVPRPKQMMGWCLLHQQMKWNLLNQGPWRFEHRIYMFHNCCSYNPTDIWVSFKPIWRHLQPSS